MSGVPVSRAVPAATAWALRPAYSLAGALRAPSLRRFACGLTDQVLSVGGMFAVNIALARVRSKEEYGLFTLSYSLFTFLAGLHNAAILEAYTIYGSGRYHGRFAKYEAFVSKNNRWLLAGISVVFVAIWESLRWLHPAFASPALLGMALACGVLLSAAFRRRTFYICRRPDLAARFSAAFFVSCMALLGVAIWANMLNGLSAFLISAAAWSLAFLVTPNPAHEDASENGEKHKDRENAESKAPPIPQTTDFLIEEPGYWSEHWKYSRWVFVTALVFQFTTQAYFWVVAAFLSVRDVAGLRAMYNLALPVDQIFAAISLLVLPQMALLFASGEIGKLRRMWGQCSLMFLAIGLAFAVTVALLNIRLIHAAYGSKFDDVAPLLRWYVIVPVVMGAGNAANAALKAVEKPQAVFFAYLASGMVTFVVGIPLVVHFGLRGAIYGMLVSAVGYTGTLLLSFTRFIKPRASCVPVN
ncbi:MAG: hypothetical protein WAL71_03620 [Terriglobales bacterium]|jgi:hypothetical protein